MLPFIVLSITCLLLASVASLFAWFSFKRIKLVDQQVKNRLEAFAVSQNAFKKTSIGMGKRLIQFEKNQQEALQTASSNDTYLFDTAIDLIRNGAQLEDIQENCHLSQAEAKLLSMIYQNN